MGWPRRKPGDAGAVDLPRIRIVGSDAVDVQQREAIEQQIGDDDSRVLVVIGSDHGRGFRTVADRVGKQHLGSPEVSREFPFTIDQMTVVCGAWFAVGIDERQGRDPCD